MFFLEKKINDKKEEIENEMIFEFVLLENKIYKWLNIQYFKQIIILKFRNLKIKIY